MIGVNGTEILINEVEYVFGPPIQAKKNRPKGLREMIKMLLENEFTAPILRDVLSSQLDNVRGHQKPTAQKPQGEQQQSPSQQQQQPQAQQQQQQQPQRQPQKFERLGPTTSAKKIISNKDPSMAKRDSELPQPVASVPTYWPTEQAPQAAQQQQPQSHSIVQTPPPFLNYKYVQAQPIGPNFYQPQGPRPVQPLVYYPTAQQEQPQNVLTRMKGLFPPGTNFAQVSGGLNEVQKTMLVLSPLMRRRPGLYSSSKGPAPSSRFDPIWSQAASRHTPQFGMTIIG